MNNIIKKTIMIMIVSLSCTLIAIAEPGMPDKPGEATSKMIDAGVITEEGIISEFTLKHGFFPNSKEAKQIGKDYKAYLTTDSVKIDDKPINQTITYTVEKQVPEVEKQVLEVEKQVSETEKQSPKYEFGGCEKCHKDVAKNFSTSLHHTGLGMFNEYKVGAMGYFDLNTTEYYEQKNCQKCHIQKCTQCHIGEGMYDVHTKKVTMGACDPCHKKKQTSTYKGEMPMHKVGNNLNADIHYEKGLICTDCHGMEDLHGDGNEYKTQLEAVNIECEDCHTNPKKVVKDMPVTQYTFDQYAHQIHVGKLDCIACHTGWSLTCNKCHIETRKGTKPTSEEFYLGVGSDGLVTTFLKMDASYNNNTHTGYGEWFSHTITSNAKDCDFCHEDRKVLCEGVNAEIIGEGGSFITQETIDRIIDIDTSLPEPVKETWFDKWILGWF